MVSTRSDKQQPPERAERGLPSIAEARARRGGMKWLPPRFWLWALVCIGAGLIVWWRIDEGKIDELRNEILARQRATVLELGPRWFPLRDKIEKWTAECAAGSFSDAPNPELAKDWDFRKLPGIYLRLAQSSAKKPETIRAAANKSLKDGFTACLFQVSNPNPLAGAKCDSTAPCPAKHICNEFGHCAIPHQPFNVRLAYKALHLLSDEWIKDTQSITNKLTMRGAVATFEASNRYDLPIATDLLASSKYFLVVVDEAAEANDGGDLDGAEVADAGLGDDRSIPTAAHPARVCLWRLEDDNKMIAVRRDADGELRGPSTHDINAKTLRARKRQANSCSLALSVREAMGAQAGAVVGVPDDDGTISPAPDVTPSAVPSTSKSASPAASSGD